MTVKPLALASRLGARSASLLSPREAPVAHLLAFVFAMVLAIVTDRGDRLPLLAGLGLLLVVLRGVMGALRAGRRRELAVGIDAVLSAAALLLTGAPFSPLLPLAISGAIDAGSQSRRGAWIYALAFLVAFLSTASVSAVGMAPGIVRDEWVMEIVKTTAFVPLSAIIGWAMSSGPAIWSLERSEVLRQVRAQRTSIRASLARALRNEPLPMDTLLAGARLGLTVEETELLGFLVLGLTNQQIADAFCLSVATVKYRLTRLYRRLGVRGRAQAVAAARQLGLDAAPPPVEQASIVDPLSQPVGRTD